LFHLLRVDVFVAEQVQHEFFARSVEKPRQELGQRTASSLRAVDDRRVSKGAALFLVAHVPFPLQDAKQREDGVVRRTRRTLDPFDDFTNRGRRQVPEHIHDAVLSVGQAGRGFASHVGTICPLVPVVN